MGEVLPGAYPADMTLQLVGRSKSQALPLAGTWRFRIAHNFGAVTTIQNSPYALYSGMIEPMVPYGLRGVIWYQGESNVGRARDYHQADIVPSGPWFRSCRAEGKKLRIRFTHLHGGLRVQEACLNGFAVAGADRKFFRVDAKIEKGTVLVSHPLVKRPVAVRYAWADNPKCNLGNLAGLPAAPFRADNWPVEAPAKIGSLP